MIALLFCIAAGKVLLGALALPSQPYHWKSVQIVGGGFVDGIVFHPSAKGLRYARTDIGGAYRWDARHKQWTPLLDWLGLEDVNLMGVESIALDPHDPDRLFMACGMYTNETSPDAAILWSIDRGRTFHRTNLPFKMGGNENGRGNGERLAVDPSAPNTLYFGSRRAGLWKSTDYAKTWNPVTSFPTAMTGGVGIVSVIFDPRDRATSSGSAVYAAVSTTGDPNLLRSRDGGATWAPIPGEPTRYRPTRMALGSDGNLFITYGSSAGPSRMRDGGLWRLDTHTDQWTEVTPEKPDSTRAFGYACVSVQADDPKNLVVSTFYRPGGEEIYRSTDSGTTWRPVFHAGGGTYDFSSAPYVAKTPIHWLFDLEIDPLDPNHAIFTTGYGGYETFDLSNVDRGRPTKWQVMSKGIEETVALELLSPPSGYTHLVSAIGDYGGFVHWNLDKPSPEGNCDNPRFGNTTGLAGASLEPRVIVRVGQAAGGTSGNIGYSLDGGHSWQRPATNPKPASSAGRVAVSADGKVWIWTPQRSFPYRTEDQGRTWTPCDGLSVDARVIADPIDPGRFYAMDLFGGHIFTSRDGGKSFVLVPLDLPGDLPKPGGDRFDGRGGQDKLYATPGRSGDLWVAAFDGLYHSADAGGVWTKMGPVQRIQAFGFGKAAPGSPDPALYLCGLVDGLRATFRSDDFGKTWTRINDDQHQWGLVLQVTGDPRIYGRVYVGTHGRGVLYGDPGR